MKGFWSTVLDENGEVVGSCSVSVYLVSTAALAIIYSDETGTIKVNPFTTDANGRYSFFVASGKYYLTFTKTGFTTWTSDYITIPDEVDETDANETKNKYVSNNIIKELYDVKLRKKAEILALDNIHNFDRQIMWLIQDKTFIKFLKAEILAFSNIQCNMPMELIKHLVKT